MYVALSGLDKLTALHSCGVATGYYIAPLRGFLRLFKQLLRIKFLSSTDGRGRYYFMNGAHFLYELIVLFERQRLRPV
jgi:hypothetical protein